MSLNPPEPTTQKQPQVTQQMVYIEKALSVLETSINELQEKLISVTCERPKTTSERAENKEQTLCELADGLRVFSTKISYQNERIRDLIADLEI